MSHQTILDTIDGAIRDAETSSDAMRWVPEDERPAGCPDVEVFTWTPEQVEAACRVMQQLDRAVRTFAETFITQFAALAKAVVDAFPDIKAAVAFQDEVETQRRAYRKYIHCDYRQRQLARRRRR